MVYSIQKKKKLFIYGFLYCVFIFVYLGNAIQQVMFSSSLTKSFSMMRGFVKLFMIFINWVDRVGVFLFFFLFLFFFFAGGGLIGAIFFFFF